MQNLAPGMTAAPQLGQACWIGVAQWMQNFPAAGVSWPHAEQVTSAIALMPAPGIVRRASAVAWWHRAPAGSPEPEPERRRRRGAGHGPAARPPALAVRRFRSAGPRPPVRGVGL